MGLVVDAGAAPGIVVLVGARDECFDARIADRAGVDTQEFARVVVIADADIGESAEMLARVAIMEGEQTDLGAYCGLIRPPPGSSPVTPSAVWWPAVACTTMVSEVTAGW